MGLHKWILRLILLLILGVFAAQVIWLQDRRLSEQPVIHQAKARNAGHVPATGNLAANTDFVIYCNCSVSDDPCQPRIVSCSGSSSDFSRQSGIEIQLLPSSDVQSLQSDIRAEESENSVDMDKLSMEFGSGVNTDQLNENSTGALPHFVASSIESGSEGNSVGVSSVEGATSTLTHYLLVVVVLSSVHGRDRRTAIRRTWMKGYQEIKPSLTVTFALGTLGLPASDLAALKAEDHLYHDLLLLHNLKDAYHNLTRKVLYIFQWADESLEFSYLLKCDDDSYIRLDAITRELNGRTSKKGLYWGYFNGKQIPKWSGKFAERKWFLCDRYLPYALGGGYVISSDLIHRVSVNADGLQLYNNEDVSVGVWLSAFKAERKHDSRFDTEWASRGCRNYHLVSHKQTIRDMLEKYHSLKSKKVLCSREHMKRGAYNYNWWVPPSRCCKH